jgi:2-dehydro-3-deoxyphosphogluconate aldolase / (4S)-4-hydroxy-2-oxoglutarate aldolase
MSFLQTRLIAILRGHDEDQLVAAAATLAAAGVTAIEISLSSRAGLGALLRCVREIDPVAGSVAWGAGTVLDPAQAHAAVGAGATFLLTPAVVPGVAAEAEKLGVPLVTGAATPSEVLTAWREGAAAVKIFPAARFGPEYLKDLHGPFPKIPLVPVGGIGLADVGAYLTNGALAVGVGSPLLGDATSGGDTAALAERARRFVAAASAARATEAAGSTGEHA